MNDNFKVVKIIDDETIVINAGKKNGIKLGNKFEIYDTGEEIFDPDTNESLGTLDTIKETVKAINVLPKMCICRHIVVTNFLEPIDNLNRVHPKMLNVETTQISGGLSSDTKIRIGDKVRLIMEDILESKKHNR